MRPKSLGPKSSAARFLAGEAGPPRVSRNQAPRSFALRRAKLITLGLTLAIAVLAGCSGGSEDAAEGAAEAPQRAAAPDQAPAEEAGVGGGDEGGAGEAAVADADDAAGGKGVPPLTQVVAATNDRIVREGTMRLEVEEAGFDAAFDRVITTAERLGGTVLSSDATSDDEGLTSGSVTVRVPAQNYDRLLTGVSEIGTVRERSITSEDVSGEFVDLEARLRHNEAQERFYLSLLEQSEGVEDAIAVQQRVADIQQTIEQIKGRLSYLEERTSFSRLTVELYETGSPFQPGGGAEPRFAEYWESARNGFVAVVGTMLVLATALLPLTLLGLVILLAIRYYRRIGARPQPASPPPPATQDA